MRAYGSAAPRGNASEPDEWTETGMRAASELHANVYQPFRGQAQSISEYGTGKFAELVTGEKGSKSYKAVQRNIQRYTTAAKERRTSPNLQKLQEYRAAIQARTGGTFQPLEDLISAVEGKKPEGPRAASPQRLPPGTLQVSVTGTFAIITGDTDKPDVRTRAIKAVADPGELQHAMRDPFYFWFQQTKDAMPGGRGMIADDLADADQAWQMRALSSINLTYVSE